MGLGSYFFGVIGAFIRWLFKGFKGSYNEIWEGNKDTDFIDSTTNEMLNNIIGVIFCFLLCILILL